MIGHTYDYTSQTWEPLLPIEEELRAQTFSWRDTEPGELDGDLPTRTCPACEETVTIVEMTRSNKSMDGIGTYCLKCSRNKYHRTKQLRKPDPLYEKFKSREELTLEEARSLNHRQRANLRRYHHVHIPSLQGGGAPKKKYPDAVTVEECRAMPAWQRNQYRNNGVHVPDLRYYRGPYAGRGSITEDEAKQIKTAQRTRLRAKGVEVPVLKHGRPRRDAA